MNELKVKSFGYESENIAMIMNSICNGYHEQFTTSTVIFLDFDQKSHTGPDPRLEKVNFRSFRRHNNSPSFQVTGTCSYENKNYKFKGWFSFSSKNHFHLDLKEI